jgi:hypothetical protein
MPMINSVRSPRTVTWEGFFNARDLGGLPTGDGATTRFRSLVRSADPRFVTKRGWKAALDAGIRTVIDLRNDDEIGTAAGYAGMPPEIGVVHVPIDDVDDAEMWAYFRDEMLEGSPLYYRPFLERKPERCAEAVTTIARTPAGGVLFHCAIGRDRTGLVSLLLLAAAGVAPEAIADDYELSASELPPLFTALGRKDHSPFIRHLMETKGTSTRQALLATLDGFDATSYLLAAGVLDDDLAAVRSRLLGEH